MLKYLIEDNELLPVFRQYGLQKADLEFIEEQVTGAKKQHSDKVGLQSCGLNLFSWNTDLSVQLQTGYCPFHVPVQTNFRRYYFYILPDQAQTHLDHWKVLDKLWCKISFKSDNR